MGLDITRLLEVRTWRAFDVDDDGRVLAGWDDTGCVQLTEVDTAVDTAQATGQARPLTALPGACRGRYLPGQRVVVVEHDDGGNERGQLSLLPVDGPEADAGPATVADLTPLVHDPEYVHHLLEVLPGRVVYNTNRRNGVDFDIVMRNVATGVEEVVYDGGGWAQEVAVSPDARYAVISLTGSAPMSDELVLIDTMPETKADRVRPLTMAGAHGQHDRICWLAGQRAFVVATDATTDHALIARYDLADGKWRPLVADERHDLICWPSPDGRLLLVQTNDNGASRLALHDAVTGERLRDVPLPGDGVVVFPMPDPSWSPSSRYLAISYTSPQVPGDVLLLDVADGGDPVAVTSSAEQLADELLSTPTVHRVPTPDGEQVPCLVYPPTREGGSAVGGSAVLVIHGGPESQSRPAFNPVVQAMTANGHTVLVPNVRGSTGYGVRWYSADDGRHRLDAVADLAALHAWLPSLGLDPSRAALWGGSYGGYMVLAGLAFQPQLWAAGVDIVGISSLITFLQNTSPYRRAAREREYGSLQADAQFLRDASPLSRVNAIRAPLFVIHGANDPRVPLSEAEQLAAAVSDNGVDCELLVYPDEGHGLAKRANRLDAYPKALSFLLRHLEPRDGEPAGWNARTQ
ncbi:MAG TPA: S9 family peptidase [Pseudonocardiaceae bacterium]